MERAIPVDPLTLPRDSGGLSGLIARWLNLRHTSRGVDRRETSSSVHLREASRGDATTHRDGTARDHTASDGAVRRGRVHLVGAGPGDPELLTLRAARLIAGADVVVYDQLVGEGVLALIPANTRRIFVGKQSGNHSLPQDDINALLVSLGLEGLQVVRLKGGDPFVFGRGGEEIESLIGAGLEFEVVPGITAASGMAAYAGIPLTHREYAQSCIFATGHLKDGTANLDWPTLARPRQTVVIYMGVGALEEICRQLVAHGLPADQPAALVRHATLDDQQTVAGTLATLPHLAAEHGVRAPALIVVGEVVKLRERFDWFSRQQATASAHAA